MSKRVMRKRVALWIKIEKDYFMKFKLVQNFLGASTHAEALRKLIDFYLQQMLENRENNKEGGVI